MTPSQRTKTLIALDKPRDVDRMPPPPLDIVGLLLSSGGSTSCSRVAQNNADTCFDFPEQSAWVEKTTELLTSATNCLNHSMQSFGYDVTRSTRRAEKRRGREHA